MNKVMLIGYVGSEPEVKYVDADTPVARVSLATSERGYTLQNGTQVPQRTDWHTVMRFIQFICPSAILGAYSRGNCLSCSCCVVTYCVGIRIRI